MQPADTNLTTTPPWCLRLTADLDAADARARAVVQDLSVAQLNWAPRPGMWSIGECLEHLCLSNEAYALPIARALDGAPSGHADEITPGWFGRWFIRTYIEPDTKKKPHRAPPKIVPRAEQLDSSILTRFIASNATMRELIARAQRHDVNDLRFINPFVPLIRFTVGTGLHIIARHNHRHLLQAECVRQHPDFPR